MESPQHQKNQNVSISSNSVYNSVAYDPLNIRMLESEAEAEEPTNHKACNWVLQLVYSSTSASDSNNLVSTRLQAHSHK